MNDAFDERNEWHIQANHLLMFVCETRSCHERVEMKDLTEEQRTLEWEELCVALSDLAQSRGWTCVGRLQFLCPQCSAARLAV
jgi:hypothetical protein